MKKTMTLVACAVFALSTMVSVAQNDAKTAAAPKKEEAKKADGTKADAKKAETPKAADSKKADASKADAKKAEPKAEKK